MRRCGRCSLAYLKRFPIDVLKIDRAFIKDLLNNREDTAIINAILAMAHGLGLTVVAEGVETEEQLRLLRLFGCDEVQGYVYSRPLPTHKFKSLLARGDRTGQLPAGPAASPAKVVAITSGSRNSGGGRGQPRSRRAKSWRLTGTSG